MVGKLYDIYVTVRLSKIKVLFPGISSPALALDILVIS